MIYTWSPRNLLSCLFVVSEVDLVVGLGRVLHDPLAQLIGPVRHFVPGLIGKYTDNSRDGSHRDNFGESLQTLSAVESQSWVSF
jgi:hypothetical protein